MIAALRTLAAAQQSHDFVGNNSRQEAPWMNISVVQEIAHHPGEPRRSFALFTESKRVLRLVVEVFAATQEMRREAQARYLHLTFDA